MNERLEDRFQLLGRIGGGSGGEVYRVRSLATGAILALKVMDARNAAIPGAEIRFRNECTGLFHENLVRVDEVLRLSGNLCLVMELIEGDSLEKMIAENWPLPVNEKIQLMAQVCRGLDFAHRSGRVHRDIKPSNILRQRQNGAPKIIDFGVAKKLGEHGPTLQGTVVGTYAYMSPEQIQGLPVDGRSDIFSAAVVLFEFLSGLCPFEGDGEYQTKESIVRGETPRLPVHLSSIPAPLHGVLQRALQKDAARRYRTAGEMADALEGCLGYWPETVREFPVPPAQPETEAPPEPRPAVPLPEKALLQPQPKPQPQPVAKTSRKVMGVSAVAALLVAMLAGGIWLAMHGFQQRVATPDEQYRDGLEHQKAGDPNAALDLFSHSCARQYGPSCTAAGIIKENGQAGSVDHPWAVKFFDRGCTLNHAWACTHLGYHYQYGLGVAADRSRASSLYLKGCKSGDASGCTLLTQLTTSRIPLKKQLKPKPAEPQHEPGFSFPNIHWDQLPWTTGR